MAALKVAACVALFGACRKSELLSLKVTDIVDNEIHAVVNIRESKTGPRTFLIDGHSEEKLNCLLMLRKYMALRRTAKIDRLFVNFRNGKCINQGIGINTLASFPSKIATFLQLEEPKTYTSHAFRRSAATWVADSGVDIINLKRFGGWKSDSVAQGYVGSSVSVKRTLALAVSGETAMTTSKDEERQQIEINCPVNISRCDNCVFNINVNSNQ